jgi:hypothetical protein
MIGSIIGIGSYVVLTMAILYLAFVASKGAHDDDQ